MCNSSSLTILFLFFIHQTKVFTLQSINFQLRFFTLNYTNAFENLRYRYRSCSSCLLETFLIGEGNLFIVHRLAVAIPCKKNYCDSVQYSVAFSIMYTLHYQVHTH